MQENASEPAPKTPALELYGLRIFVDDFTKARAFYNQILGLEELWAYADIKAAGYNAGTTLIVEEVQNEPTMVGRFLGASLKVDDINATYLRLKEQGVEFSGLPQKQQWGGTLTHFKDTAGNVLTLLGD